MLLLSNEHGELWDTILQSRPDATTPGSYGEDKVRQELEENYEMAYHDWERDNDLAAPYESFKSIREILTSKGKKEPRDDWSLHLLVRCCLLGAREPNIGIKQIELRSKAKGYAVDIQRPGQRGSERCVSGEMAGKMEELAWREQCVFDPLARASTMQKLKAKASHLFANK
ncbi:MAG: hypothetical protein Q9168_004157 [Polycauliona sp. 1 TL-2023]